MREQIIRLGVEGTFTPKEVAILIAAFDSAWTTVQSSGAPFAGPDHEERGRNLIAKAIMRRRWANSISAH
jgi:hypothetical protein